MTFTNTLYTISTPVIVLVNKISFKQLYSSLSLICKLMKISQKIYSAVFNENVNCSHDTRTYIVWPQQEMDRQSK